MKRYDVGIMGLWSGCNYGSIITYYALNRVVASMGKSILMIDKPVLMENDVEHKETHSRRFAREHYNISKQYRLDEVSELNSICDTFLIGSDQVWNYEISKEFGKIFYFDFAGIDNKKIAYAVSFGHSMDFAPPEERKIISKCMSHMDGIAVREHDGVRLCRDKYGIKAIQVLDPVFLAKPEIYKPLIEKSNHRENEDFIVTYILDPTPEKCEAARHIAEKLGGIKIISLLDGLPWLYEANRAKTNLPNCIENLQVEDWLYYLSHAKFVLTDSFHGASFALIFQKSFIAMTNQERGVSRFRSLSELFKFEDRLVDDPRRILNDDNLLRPLDYDVIMPIMEAERSRCYKWLQERLDEAKASVELLEMRNKIAINNITEKLESERCMGCGACASSCPRDALTLLPDKLGYYRASVDLEKCVDCGQCVNVCPAYKLPKKENRINPACFEFMSSSDEVLQASSSGGAFATLAGEAFRRDGAVAGAAWSADHVVEHILVEDARDLYKLQKSKYLQSYLGLTFRKIKELADKGRFVLFSGCPCQVAGLKKFLGKEYDNVLLVDLLCGNSPSAGFFEKYIKDSFPEGIKSYEFRYKGQGWNSDCVKVTLNSGRQEVRRGGKDDDYQRVYHNHAMCAVHCENCQYQSLPRYGDLTIGDFWGIGERHEVRGREKGVSVILCNNKKGKSYLSSIPAEYVGIMNEVPLEWLGGNGYAIGGSHNYADPRRNHFYEAVQKMPFRKAVDYALKPNHGKYQKQAGSVPLDFNGRKTVFAFDERIWEEHRIKGMIVLFLKQPVSRPGVYAVMPLDMPLKKGTRYVLQARFKVRTTSEFLNFHVKDSGSMAYQVIHWHRTRERDEWIELNEEFMADSNIYDEFFFGASQLQGEDACLAIDYLRILERGNGREIMGRAWERVYELIAREMPWRNLREILRSTDDIVAYLELLLVISRKCTVILSVRDTPGSSLSDEIMDRIDALGFTNFSKELWRMYVGFVDAGQVICNLSGEAREEPVSFSCQSPDNKDEFAVISKAWRQGDVAEININGVDYAANLRGFNIVVYDRETHEVWDSIGFDGHDNGVGFVRRNVKS